jgi:glycosyltransferase involved in cell wall biosynthesis
MAPSVSINVASFNTKAATELCVRSIHRYAGFPFDLTVGDSGSTDGSLELLADFERAGLLRLERGPQGRHHSEWLDHWLENATSDYILFVDSDMDFRRHGWLKEMVATATAREAAVVYSEWLEEVPFFTEPVGHNVVRLAERPAPWLLMFDVRRVGKLGTGFAFTSRATDEVPEGKIAYDTGAMLHHEVRARGLETVHLPASFMSSYRHFGGLSWRGLTGGRLASRRVRYALMRLRLQRLRAAA